MGSPLGAEMLTSHNRRLRWFPASAVTTTAPSEQRVNTAVRRTRHWGPGPARTSGGRLQPALGGGDGCPQRWGTQVVAAGVGTVPSVAAQHLRHMPPVAREEWLRLSSLLNDLDDEDVPCRGTDPDPWRSDAKELKSPSTAFAIAACRRCPVQSACVDYALAGDERYGIGGATLLDERRTSVTARRTAR